MRVLVLGGYGNFGARICRNLAGHPRMEVISAGRNPPASPPGSNLRSARLDLAASDFPAALRALYPDLVVHCAGPFQGQDYRVAAAALAAGERSRVRLDFPRSIAPNPGHDKWASPFVGRRSLPKAEGGRRKGPKPGDG